MSAACARNTIIANSRAVAALDEPSRVALRGAAERAATRGLRLAQEAERATTERLREKGMQVQAPSPGLLAQLREVGARQVQDWAQKAGPEGQQMLERYQAAR
jgi:TRAP-type transport system periplasmic protein